MTTLRLYIFREIVPPILMSAVFFTTVLLLVRLFDFAGLLIKAGVKGSLFGELLLIIGGTVMVLTIPMAVLLGAIIGVGRLTNENELLAIRVAGINLARVFYPVLIAAFLVSVFMMGVNQYVVPSLFKRIDSLVYQIQFDVLTKLRPGTVYKDMGPPGTEMSLYFDEHGEGGDPGELVIKGVNVRVAVERDEFLAESTSDQENEDVFFIFAESGTIKGAPDDEHIQMILKNGMWLPEEMPTSSQTKTIQFGQLESRLDVRGKDLEELGKVLPQELQFSQLLEFLNNPPDDTAKIRDDEKGRRIPRVWKEYYSARNEMIQRFTLPLSIFSFIILAIPLAIEIRPRAKSLSLIMAVVLMASYYALFALAQSVSSSGASWTVSILAFLLPNIVMIGVGSYMFWRATQK